MGQTFTGLLYSVTFPIRKASQTNYSQTNKLKTVQ
ncbi:MAG: hypothetical protein MAGBODY4_00242 [Candidatus Marinimicrobia bacterium]|nr:hypothetical protein [Candidatus Neomarinimicrobiota bacterium]